MSLGLCSPAAAQTGLEPGLGAPVPFGSMTAGAGDRELRFADLQEKRRVRGIRLLASQSGCIIENVTVTYSNGQVHKEDREIQLKAGERSAVIDPRFDDRSIETVVVALKPGACASATLELQGVVGDQSGTRTVARSAKRATRGIETGRPVTGAPAPPPEPYTTVDLYYGTDRKSGEPRVRGAGARIGTYNAEPANRLELGRATVTIPKSRPPGTITRPEIGLLITSLQYRAEDLARDFTVASVDAMQPADFVAAMKSRLGQARKFQGHAFVFIHGYFVTFDDAIFRAAQITYDMGFDGLPLVYSWPSVGKFNDYFADRDRAKASRDPLKQFLDLVAAQSGASQIHLIAHSTGAFALLEALDRIRLTSPETADATRFGEIVFAAPDVLADDFRIAMTALKGLARGTTLYASKADRALQLSEFARNGLPAAGIIPASNIPVLVGGVDSVDVSLLNTSYFTTSHSTFGDALPLLQDMGKLFATGYHPPSVRDRSFLEYPAPQNAGMYWRWAP